MIPARGDYQDWEQVVETAHAWQAELMALRLRENGIEAEVLDQTFNQEPLPNVRAFAVVRVLVPKGKGDEARRVLAAVEPLSEEHEEEDAKEDP